MSERGKKAGVESGGCTSVDRLFFCFFLFLFFSAPAVTDYNGSPKTPSIYITAGKLMTVLNYCIPMRYSRSMTRGTAVISHRQPHKNSLQTASTHTSCLKRLNPVRACFFELVIKRAQSVTGKAK